MPNIVEIAESLESPGEAEEESVSPLELFFDLVFVFAITQVTQLIANEPEWHGMAKAMVLLALIWWAWSAYAWLTDSVDTGDDRVRFVLFAAMIGMFVAALVIPRAFDDRALVFAVAYGAVRVLHVLLFAYGSRDLDVKRAALALGPSVGVALALVLLASLFDGAAQGALFCLAILIDYVGGGRGVENFRLHPGYFTERYQLVVMLAFGESVVATGIGAQDTPLGTPQLVAGGLLIVLTAALWWAYFDVASLVAERRLRQAAPGREQNTMARDSYSYLHLFLIAGIVLVALGAKKTIGHTDGPLEIVPAVSLCGGVALYLVTHSLFRLRNTRTLNRQRLVVAAVALALIPVARTADALVTLALLTAVCCALIGYEVARFGDARRRVRAALG